MNEKIILVDDDNHILSSVSVALRMKVGLLRLIQTEKKDLSHCKEIFQILLFLISKCQG